MEIEKKEYRISTDPAQLNIEVIYNYLSKEAYWSKGIPLNVLQRSIDNSFNFGLFHLEKQIGYARIVTDYATVAYLGDVFILSEFRGRGLSKWMMETIMNHPDLQGLRQWILLTGNAHGLYQQFGWTSIVNPERWMEVGRSASDLY